MPRQEHDRRKPVLVAVLAWTIIGSGVGWIASLCIPHAFDRRLGDIALWKGVGILSALAVSVLSAPLLTGTSSIAINPIYVLFAFTSASLVYSRNRVRARWQRHREARLTMRHITYRAPEGGDKGVERLDLLMWRFSSDEIARLTALQIRHRERLDRHDLQLDVYHLRFARWLIEHGRLSEHACLSCEWTPWKEEEAQESR
jgi:hypothetical protein